MAANLTLYPQSHSSSSKILYTHHSNLQPNIAILHFPLRRTSSFSVQASKSFSAFTQEGDKLVGDSRFRSKRRGGRPGVGFGDFDVDDEDEDEDGSLDLLVKFVNKVFRKVSRKARKAVRSVLPVAISSQLVEFSVNGVIILAFLWVLKALLEVICTLGSVVFVSILLIRGVWMGISYLQDTRNQIIDNDEHHAWTSAQPMS